MISYKDKLVNFDLVLFALAEDGAERANIFNFLQENRHRINDNAILGVLDFLSNNNNDYDLLARTILKIEQTDFSKSPRLYKRKGFLMYAASLVLLMALGSYYFLQQSTPSIFVPHEYGLDNMLSSDSFTTPWVDFAALFVKKDYQNAILVLEGMPDGVALDSLAYFKGVSAFKMGDYKLAEESFSQLQQYEHSVFFQDSEYFFAISLLKRKKTESARQALQAIMEQETHPFRDESKYLLANFY
jgi:hypothetical protein